MGRIYPLITEKNTIAQDILILVAIAVGFKMQYVALLYMRSRAVSKLEPPISVSVRILIAALSGGPPWRVAESSCGRATAPRLAFGASRFHLAA